MSQVPAWFQRKFEFTFPVEFYPNLAARLRGTPARMEETLRGRSHEILVKKESGKWSAQEHAGHLLDLEPLWTARVRDFVKGGVELTAADLKNQKTHDANHNARPLEEILANFRNARMSLMTELATMKPEQYCPHHAASTSQTTDAFGRSLVLRRRARRPSPGENLGTDSTSGLIV